MGLLSLLGVWSPAHISLQTLFGGKLVGRDAAGNKYYRGKLPVSAQSPYRREKRWVMYNGAPEASKVPPEWHGWLHYQTDAVPGDSAQSFRRPWQKPHNQNMTGTAQAYRPPGHVLAGGQRDGATGDYQAWSPDSE